MNLILKISFIFFAIFSCSTFGQCMGNSMKNDSTMQQ